MNKHGFCTASAYLVMQKGQDEDEERSRPTEKSFLNCPSAQADLLVANMQRAAVNRCKYGVPAGKLPCLRYCASSRYHALQFGEVVLVESPLQLR